MKTSEKQKYVLGAAISALHEMRGIEVENGADDALADQARKELLAAFAGGISLAPVEQKALQPLIDAYRKLWDRAADFDDGQDCIAWDAEVADMMPEVESGLVPATDGIDDTRHIVF